MLHLTNIYVPAAVVSQPQAQHASGRNQRGGVVRGVPWQRRLCPRRKVQSPRGGLDGASRVRTSLDGDKNNANALVKPHTNQSFAVTAHVAIKPVGYCEWHQTTRTTIQDKGDRIIGPAVVPHANDGKMIP